MTTHRHTGRAGIQLLAPCLLGLAAAAGPAGGALPQPDFAAARDETVRVLTNYLRIDTSNPPGNETRGAQYLKSLFDREGIPAEIVAAEPNRGNLVARLKGRGTKPALLLMAHSDVVGVERAKWTVDPFGGVIRDGYVYGRGASDNKDLGSVFTEIMLLLHRLKIPLERDVIFLAEAGEESSAGVGIDYMISNHWDKIACEFALDEGGRIFEQDGRVQYVAISTTEKVPRPFRLAARGRSGHGSRPLPDNAIVHLAAAVAKVGAWQPPLRLNDTTRTYFSRLARIAPPEEGFLYAHLEDPVLGPLVQEKLRATKPGPYSMLRTSVSPTLIQGGFRQNVIPAEAEATLDVRALPDEDLEAFAERLRQLIDDPAVEVRRASRSTGQPPAPSRLDTELFRAFERVQARLFPGAATLPTLLTGATDSADLRARGVQAYGVGCVLSDEDSARVHGHDERVSIAGLGKALEFIYGVVVEVAAAKP